MVLRRRGDEDWATNLKLDVSGSARRVINIIIDKRKKKIFGSVGKVRGEVR